MDVRTMSLFFALLTVGADAFVVLALVLRASGSNSWRRFRDALAPSALWAAWGVAVVATAGSLYLSEVAHFTPCTLCWYQRIGMYPMSVLLGIAAFKRDVGFRRYVIPIAAVAMFISLYHYQLERFPGQAHPTCMLDAPCTFVWIWQFHFISIPFMALSAFALILSLITLTPKAGAAAEAVPDEELAA